MAAHYMMIEILLLVLLPIYTCAYSECDPDQQCINNRICSFGDVETYKSVATKLFAVTSCENCINQCTSECNCSTTSQVQMTLNALEATTDNTTGWCKGNAICNNPLIQKALAYPTLNLPCERGFKNAQNYIVKLCGTVNGECCRGHCLDYMIDVPTPRCDQYKGHTKEARWLFTVYIIITLILWQWSTNQDVGALLRSQEESVQAANTNAHFQKYRPITNNLSNFL